MSTEKRCPILLASDSFAACRKNECIWFDEEATRCMVISVGTALSNIESQLDSVRESLDAVQKVVELQGQ